MMLQWLRDLLPDKDVRRMNRLAAKRRAVQSGKMRDIRQVRMGTNPVTGPVILGAEADAVLSMERKIRRERQS